MCQCLPYIFFQCCDRVPAAGVKRKSRSGPKTIFSGIWRSQNARQRRRSVRRPQVRNQGSRMTIWDHAHSIRKNTIALERTLQKILGDINFPFRGYLPYTLIISVVRSLRCMGAASKSAECLAAAARRCGRCEQPALVAAASGSSLPSLPPRLVCSLAAAVVDNWHRDRAGARDGRRGWAAS